jgi:branched-chain amino acid transport system substrate-binding protein
MRWHAMRHVALAVLSVLVIGAPWPGMAQAPMRIGASMALTGKYALQGGYARDGYQLCQKHVNERRRPGTPDRVRDSR